MTPFKKTFALLLLFVGFTLNLSAQDQAEKINWVSIEEAIELQKQEPRAWMIDFYTDWCGWCKRMDASTFADPKVAEIVNKYYYAIKFDGEAKHDIDFKGVTYKFKDEGRRGYHELAAAFLQGKMSYPSFAFLNKEEQMLQVIPGYKDTKEMHKILSYIGSEAYSEMKWEEYDSAYTSPYKD